MIYGRKWQVAGMAVLTAGLIFAQDNSGTTPSQQPEHKQGSYHRQRRNRAHRLAADLNLSDAQKTQARQIFQTSREASRPMVQQLRQYRRDLAAAVKTGAAEAQIDELAAKMGPVMSQMAAVHAKAFAKFYAILTPDQQQQLGQRGERFFGGMQADPGRPAAHRPAPTRHGPPIEE